MFVVAEIATGTNAGTYFGEATMGACTEVAAAGLATSW